MQVIAKHALVWNSRPARAWHFQIHLCLASALLTNLFPIAASAVTVELSCVAVTDETATTLAERFSAALQTRHPDRTTRLYASDGALQGFASPVARADYASIREYYLYFLQFEPQLTVVDRTVEHGCNYLVDTGNHIWSLKPVDQAEIQKVPGRYRIVYEHNGNEWQIAEHLEELTLANPVDGSFAVPDPQPTRTTVATSASAPAVAGFLKRSTDSASDPKSAAVPKRPDALTNPAVEIPVTSKATGPSRLGLKQSSATPTARKAKTEPEPDSIDPWKDGIGR